MKDRYAVGECPRCKELLIADTRYQSKTCPKCAGRIVLKDVKILHSASDSREARTILSNAKAQRAQQNQT